MGQDCPERRLGRGARKPRRSANLSASFLDRGTAPASGGPSSPQRTLAGLCTQHAARPLAGPAWLASLGKQHGTTAAGDAGQLLLSSGRCVLFPASEAVQDTGTLQHETDISITHPYIADRGIQARLDRDTGGLIRPV